MSFATKTKLAKEKEKQIRRRAGQGRCQKKREDYTEALEEGLKNGDIDLDNLVFLDESGLKLGQTPDYARAEGGKRAVCAEPKHLGKNITVVAAISLVGVLAAMYCTCTFNGEGFEAFVEELLVPALEPGQILILDNVGFHKGSSVIKTIENMWSKLKTYLKSKKVKTLDDLKLFLKKGLNTITEHDCEA